MSRRQELASALVRWHERLKRAEQTLTRYSAENEPKAGQRQYRKLRQVFELAQNDVDVLHSMLMREVERDAV